ncbi:hypothetical protein B0H17DRAFT_1127284 [Mycena rosella]|uniref:Uncharacterized protein n=1 Tax=Mycena rosella TaxID=1033263 RepID=A0AAD7GRI1_MYCRO|nr:hypothetical protein B0H17DRAFT_1127284 [Mycena rosella]
MVLGPDCGETSNIHGRKGTHYYLLRRRHKGFHLRTYFDPPHAAQSQASFPIEITRPEISVSQCVAPHSVDLLCAPYDKPTPGTLTPSPPDARARGAATILCSTSGDLRRATAHVGPWCGGGVGVVVGFTRGWRMPRVSRIPRARASGTAYRRVGQRARPDGEARGRRRGTQEQGIWAGCASAAGPAGGRTGKSYSASTVTLESAALARPGVRREQCPWSAVLWAISNGTKKGAAAHLCGLVRVRATAVNARELPEGCVRWAGDEPRAVKRVQAGHVRGIRVPTPSVGLGLVVEREARCTTRERGVELEREHGLEFERSSSTASECQHLPSSRGVGGAFLQEALFSGYDNPGPERRAGGGGGCGGTTSSPRVSTGGGQRENETDPTVFAGALGFGM